MQRGWLAALNFFSEGALSSSGLTTSGKIHEQKQGDHKIEHPWPCRNRNDKDVFVSKQFVCASILALSNNIPDSLFTEWLVEKGRLWT